MKREEKRKKLEEEQRLNEEEKMNKVRNPYPMHTISRTLPTTDEFLYASVHLSPSSPPRVLHHMPSVQATALQSHRRAVRAGWNPNSLGRMSSIFTTAVLTRSGTTTAKGPTDVLLHDF